MGDLQFSASVICRCGRGKKQSAGLDVKIMFCSHPESRGTAILQKDKTCRNTLNKLHYMAWQGEVNEITTHLIPNLSLPQINPALGIESKVACGLIKEHMPCVISQRTGKLILDGCDQ